MRIHLAARHLGLPVTTISSSDSHARYRIGEREVVLPKPIPDQLARQVIADLGSTR